MCYPKHDSIVDTAHGSVLSVLSHIREMNCASAIVYAELTFTSSNLQTAFWSKFSMV